MSKDEHKKKLLGIVAEILDMNDDLAPEDMDLEGQEYERWNRARNEIVRELRKRSGQP